MSASTASPKKSPVVPAAAASPVAATQNSIPEAEAVNDASATRRSITGSLSWFGTKIIQTIERIGETVVDILGIDDSRFQDVLDGMTEEEMERAVAVNAQREREYREAGIITDDTLGQDDPDENEFQLPNLFTSRVTVSKANGSKNTTDIESGGNETTADNRYPIDIREIQSSGSVMIVDTKTVDSKQLLVPFPSPGGKLSPQKTQRKSPPNTAHPAPSLEAAIATQVLTLNVSDVSPAAPESSEESSSKTLEAALSVAAEAAHTLSTVESKTATAPRDAEPASSVESVALAAAQALTTDTNVPNSSPDVSNVPPPPAQIFATDCVTTVPPRPSSPAEKTMKVKSPSASKAMKANRSSPSPPPNPFAAAEKKG